MKRLVALLAVVFLALPAVSYADYKDSEAYNVAKRIIEQTMEERGCSDFRFAIFDYNVHREGDLYAVYSDVKYVDRRGKNQRDYFALMFRETNDGYEPHFLSMGALFYILPDSLQVTAR